MPTSVSTGIRVTLLGMACSGVLATVKLATGLIGHSYALVADAVESFADMAGSAIVWGSLVVSARPPDHDHPYGHGKAQPLGGLAVGLMLVGAAVGISIQAVNQIIAPLTGPAPFTLFVLVLVIVVKEALYRFALRVGDSIDSTVVRVDAWHHRSDAFTSLAAFIGIGISVYGGPGYESADGWAALAASGLIAFNGVRFIRMTAGELMDVQPPPEVLEGMAQAAREVSGVKRVEKVLARKVGTSYLVDMHIEVDGAISVREGHNLAHVVKDVVRSHNPGVADVLIHIEPYNAK
ncbi:MAG: cation diffusion facilitator family transporter [Phycisphaerae bacterium]